MKEITKINETEHSSDDSLPVYEAEIINEEIILPKDSTEVSRRKKSPPPAYTVGRIVGVAASFLFTYFKATRPLNRRGQKGRPQRCGQGSRYRQKKYREDF